MGLRGRAEKDVELSEKIALDQSENFFWVGNRVFRGQAQKPLAYFAPREKR